jgi:hypothetical protein
LLDSSAPRPASVLFPGPSRDEHSGIRSRNLHLQVQEPPPLSHRHSSRRGVLRSGIWRSTAALQAFCNQVQQVGPSGGRDGGAVATLGPPIWHPSGHPPSFRDGLAETAQEQETMTFPRPLRPSQRPSVQLSEGLWRLSKPNRGWHGLAWATRQQPAPVGHSHRAACSDLIRSNHLTHTRDVVHEGNVHPRRRHTLKRTSPPPQHPRPK